MICAKGPYDYFVPYCYSIRRVGLVISRSILSHHKIFLVEKRSPYTYIYIFTYIYIQAHNTDFAALIRTGFSIKCFAAQFFFCFFYLRCPSYFFTHARRENIYMHTSYKHSHNITYISSNLYFLAFYHMHHTVFYILCIWLDRKRKLFMNDIGIGAWLKSHFEHTILRNIESHVFWPVSVCSFFLLVSMFVCLFQAAFTLKLLVILC